MNPNFRTRSAYTFFESLLTPEKIINFALEAKFNEVFLIDKNIMYGVMPFYFLAKKNNLKPIIGLEVDYQQINKIYVAKNNRGYHRLIKLSSAINTNQVIDFADYDDDNNLLKFAVDNLPIYSYQTKDDLATLLMFAKIGDKTLTPELFHPLTTDEKSVPFDEQLLDEIDLIIPEQTNALPSFAKFSKLTISDNDLLKKLIKDNFKDYLKANKTLDIKKYRNRLEYEFNVIEKLNFASYFLIVADIVKFAKDNDIFVGPGRGSAPASLIAFIIKITDVDPLLHNLIFERFLNPDRISMPDIDIDFEDTKREQIINYLFEKYGLNHLGQIITFSTLKAKMAFRDVARFFDLDNKIAEQITKNLKDNEDLATSFKNNANFRKAVEADSLYLKIFDTAKTIEGLPRQFSTHAAGIVLTDKNITDSVPIQNGFNNLNQTQYTMDYMEYNGLLKIDILGLRNLSFLHEVFNNINSKAKTKLEFITTNFNDKKVFQLLSKGLTGGIFQLESERMTSFLKKMVINQFEDIVATTSLYRPGTLKMIESYIKRKNGEEEITYLVKEFEPILKSTYGIIVYQEQIMELVQVFANFSLAKADLIRRAISKKDVNKVEELKADFFTGAKERKHPTPLIQTVYDLIYEFSKYGFNRSHAFAYSIISYNLAYLKLYYPLEFMTSLLNSVLGNFAKTVNYIKEAREMNLTIAFPTLNDGIAANFVYKKAKIFVPLRSIKGFGEMTMQALITALDGKKCNDYYDFFIYINDSKISAPSIDLLIKAGLLDGFGLPRTTLLLNKKIILDYVNLIRIEKDNQVTYQRNLISLPTLAIPEQIISNFSYELEVFGFSLSSNPLLNFKELLKTHRKLITIAAVPKIAATPVEIIGVINSLTEKRTKKGNFFAEVIISDESGQIFLIFWPKSYEQYKAELIIGKVVLITGKVDIKYKQVIVVDRLKSIEEGE